MMALSAEIREKPNWQKKLEDWDIINNWWLGVDTRIIDRKMFEYVIDEIKYYASIQGPIEVCEQE